MTWSSPGCRCPWAADEVLERACPAHFQRRPAGLEVSGRTTSAKRSIGRREPRRHMMVSPVRDLGPETPPPPPRWQDGYEWPVGTVTGTMMDGGYTYEEGEEDVAHIASAAGCHFDLLSSSSEGPGKGVIRVARLRLASVSARREENKPTPGSFSPGSKDKSSSHGCQAGRVVSSRGLCGQTPSRVGQDRRLKST